MRIRLKNGPFSMKMDRFCAGSAFFCVCLFYVPYVDRSVVMAVFTEVRGTYARFSLEFLTDRFFSARRAGGFYDT